MADEKELLRMGHNETLSLSALLDPAVLSNPYPLYRKIRERDEVLWDPLLRAWILTRYDDCIEALQQLSSARSPKPGLFTQSGFEELEPLAEILGKQMINVDPPEHTRFRQAFTSAFRSEHIESLRLQIFDMASSLIDELPSTGEVDIVSEFTSKLPAMVVAAMLGAPVEDYLQLRAWASDFAQVLGNMHYSEETSKQLTKSSAELVKYFQSALETSPSGQNHGVIQSLSKSVLSERKISVNEYVANCIIALVGGIETVSSLLSSGMLAALKDSSLMESLVTEPEVPKSFIEEILRYEPPTQYTSRIVPVGKTFKLGSTLIKEGHTVLVVLAAANRDPSRFTEPDLFNPLRDNNRHLSFGWGHHFCFGANLARMEAQISLTILLKRLQNPSLTNRSLVWREALPSRALSSLSITYRTRTGHQRKAE